MKKIVKREPINPKEYNFNAIKSIKNKYPEFRQIGKSVTFALQYGGTYVTLMKNFGFSKETAINLEKAYHQLYVVSDEWNGNQLLSAKETGYVTCAFGLKVRTPLIKNIKSRVSNERASEERTAQNALGQSWGLLNNRAMNAVLKRIDEAGYSDSIYPIAAIHDASYYMIKNNSDLVSWFNQVVCEEASWQEHPAIQHDEVKLSGNLDIYFPDWSNPITLPDKISSNDLITFCYNKFKGL